MSARPLPTVDALAVQVTGRRTSLFAAAMQRHAPAIAAAVAGRRLLVIGGAGSIGSATVRELLRAAPAELVVVDHDENGLAELVRDVRSGDGDRGARLRALPLDFGSALCGQLVAGEPPFDLVLNFAALKHVRSEKDRASLLQLLDTNLVKAERLLRVLAARGGTSRYFAVSTDKAADPANLMGASKRLLELLICRDGALPGAVVTSARFANVAFSAGSLLDGFLRRLAKGQPLAVPAGARRYFVTPREAGELCTLAATIAPHQHLLVPELAPGHDLVLLEDVASLVVEAHGFRPRFVDGDEAAARALAATASADGVWPILRTPLDTTGEKPFEQFVATGERTLDIGIPALRAIVVRPGAAADVVAFVAALADEIAAPRARSSLDELAAAIGALLPGFVHRRSARHLDQRM